MIPDEPRVKTMHNRLFAGSIFLTLNMIAAGAHAGSAADRAAADALFREGRTLVKAGKFVEACPKLEASQKLDPTVGRLLALGDCEEQWGKTASAWAIFNDARALAKTSGDTKREAEAQRRADLIEPKLSKLTIEVPADVRVAGLEVKRNGKTLDAALFGSAIPVDPGEQIIEATAQGMQSWTTKVAVEAKPGVTPVRVPKLEAVPVVKPDPGTTPPTNNVEPGKTNSTPSGNAGSTTPPVKPDKPASSWNTQKTAAVIVGGVGVVGLALGTVAGVVTINEMQRVKDERSCNLTPPVRCSPQGFDRLEDAGSSATASNVFFGIGGAAVVTSIVLIATSSKKKTTTAESSLFVSPAIAPTMTGISLQGAF